MCVDVYEQLVIIIETDHVKGKDLWPDYFYCLNETIYDIYMIEKVGYLLEGSVGLGMEIFHAIREPWFIQKPLYTFLISIGQTVCLIGIYS